MQFHCHPLGRAAVDNSLKLKPTGKFRSAVLNLGPREAADFPKRTVCVAYWALRKASPTALTHLSRGGGPGLGVSQLWQRFWCRWAKIHVTHCLAFHVRASHMLYKGTWGGKVGKEGVCLHTLSSFKLLPSPGKGGYRIPLNLCILGWLFLSGRAEPGSTSLSQSFSLMPLISMSSHS